MNYSTFKLQQLHYKDFIKNLEAQYPGLNWSDVQQSINKMFKEVFYSGSATPPPLGYGRTFQARAMYGIDLMIDEGFKPKLLGTRVCKFFLTC